MVRTAMQPVFIVLFALSAFTSIASADWIDVFNGAWPAGRSLTALQAYNSEIVVGTDSGSYGQGQIWDGAGWTGFFSGAIPKDYIEYEGDLIVGGSFSEIGGIHTSNIARWDGESWSTLGSGLAGDHGVCLAIYQGHLYAGGTNLGDVFCWDGISWTGIGCGPGYVYAMTVFNDVLIIGSGYAWDGEILIPMQPTGETTCALVEHQGDLYAGGFFGVKTIHDIGDEWILIGDVDFAGAVFKLASYYGDLYAAGDYHEIGGVDINHISMWNGEFWSPLGIGIESHANELLVDRGGLYVGGWFSEAGGYPSDSIAYWETETPMQITVLDVPDDQGGSLTINWEQHPNDNESTEAPIVEYAVQRLDGDWIDIATVPADLSAEYSIEITTDDVFKVGQDEPWSLYRVVAFQDYDSMFYYSEVDSGYSIDNIPPPVPYIVLVENGHERFIVWTIPDIPDFEETCIFRGTEPGFVPGDPIVCTTENTWEEQEALMYYYRAQFSDTHGNLSEFSNEESPDPTSVGGGVSLALSLLPNHPNPFNPQTTIKYELPEPTPVTLRIFDLAGRLVDVLVEGETMSAGSHTATWTGRDSNGRSLPSGTYFYRLEADGFVETRRMTLIR